MHSTKLLVVEANAALRKGLSIRASERIRGVVC
jgi:hypothetical protein